MKTIVATIHPELARDLDRDLLRRSDLRLILVRTTVELVDRAQRGADLCFLGRVEGGTPQSVIRALRGDRRTAQMPVVRLVEHGGPMGRPEAERDFDDLLELPAPPGALALLLCRFLGTPLREGERFPVRVHVFSEAPPEGAPGPEGPPPKEYLGTTVDLSEVGLLLKTRRSLPIGERLGLRFALPGHPGELDVIARVVRLDPESYAPEVGVGLCYESLAEVDRRALTDYLLTLCGGRPFRWHITRDGERQVIALSGVLRAGADLLPLSQLRGELDFRLREFRRISSDSIQTWLDLIRALTGASKIRLLECPIAFVQQANAISNLLQQTQVVSFYAPYVCPRCGLDEERLIDVARDLLPEVPARSDVSGPLGVRPPSFPCSGCGASLCFDDLPERYFAFLQD